jgi:hypothetical protein
MTPAQARAALAGLIDTDFPTVPLAEVRDEDDHQITGDSVDRLIDAAHAVIDRRGRPSLTAPGQRSPQITLRLSAAEKARLDQVAAAQQRRQSDIVRDALARYLDAT